MRTLLKFRQGINNRIISTYNDKIVIVDKVCRKDIFIHYNKFYDCVLRETDKCYICHKVTPVSIHILTDIDYPKVLLTISNKSYLEYVPSSHLEQKHLDYIESELKKYEIDNYQDFLIDWEEAIDAVDKALKQKVKNDR